MVDVYIVVYTLLGILLTLPALLVALNMLLPGLTSRVQIRLEETPRKSFFLGAPVTAVFALWVALTTSTGNGAIAALGYIAALFWMGLGTIGAAGMSRLLAERITIWSEPRSRLIHLLRGAFVYELACLFPIVGWLLFAPVAGITVIGAAIFALLKWIPQRQPLVITPAPMTENG